MRIIYKFCLEDVLLGRTLSFVLRFEAHTHTHTHTRTHTHIHTSPCSVSFLASFEVRWPWELHKSYTGWRGNQLFSSDTDAGMEWVVVQFCYIWVSSCNATSHKLWAICIVSFWLLLVFLVSEKKVLGSKKFCTTLGYIGHTEVGAGGQYSQLLSIKGWNELNLSWLVPPWTRHASETSKEMREQQITSFVFHLHKVLEPPDSSVDSCQLSSVMVVCVKCRW